MRDGRSRSGAAWIGSAFLHALIAALVWRAGNRAVLRAPPPELVELDVEIGAGPSPSARQTARGDQKNAPRRSSSRARLAPSPADQSAAPGVSSSPAPSAPPSSPADEGGGGPRIELSFGALPDDVKGRFAGPRPEGVLRARPQRFDVDELRAELERREDAVANVDKGRVDPLLFDYLRGARARFQRDADRLAGDLAVGGGDALRSWARGYARSLEEMNRGALGAAADAPREDGGDTRNGTFPGADVLGQYREAHRQAEAGAEERSAEVCLDVAAGRETAVALRRSSGNAALDRLTVESFTKAVAARPVPPDARRGLACYEVRISAHRMPPLPFVACGFDLGFGGLTCAWPFKKVTSVKGRLLSVEYPSADGRQAPPSLLRKPR